jgi:hypothetical protein
MDLPDELTAFWAKEVLPNKPCKFTVPSDTVVSLTNAALDQSTGIGVGRVILFVSVNDCPRVAVVSFIIGRIESSGLDLRFSQGDRVTFETAGAEIGIHLCGYVIGGLCFDIDNGAAPPASTE